MLMSNLAPTYGPDYHRERLDEGLGMSLLEPLIALALIVLAVVLVEILTHHWLVEIVLYVLLGVCGMFALFFIYGALIDLFHEVKARLKRKTEKKDCR
jgi:Flp pilus assembly protein TadB